MLIVLALRRPIGTGKAFHKAGPNIEKALDPDPGLFFIRGRTNLFEFVERRYFVHFGRTSRVVWLSEPEYLGLLNTVHYNS